MKKTFNSLVLALLFSTTIYGQQDKHFSMFTESPIFINPATAGSSPEQIQLFTNFRTQWLTVSDQPYRTISASADFRLLDPDGNKASNFLGAGVNFYNDRSGATNYTTNVISFPFSYAFQIGAEDHLSIGLQPAFFQRSISSDNLTWDSQWTGVKFDQTMNNNESFLTQNLNISRFDMSAGIYWSKKLSPYSKLNLGVAGHHLTKQRINVFGDDSKLLRKVTLHGQGEFKTSNKNVTILPAFITFIQGPNKSLTFGSAVSLLIKGESKHTSYFENMKLNLGGYFRVKDAIIAQAMLTMKTLTFGIAYDLNVSRLNIASKGVGAMEFFIRYRLNYEGRTLGNPTIKKD